MVRRGLAYASKAGEGSHGDELRNAMSEAIRGGRGLWHVGSQSASSQPKAAGSASPLPPEAPSNPRTPATIVDPTGSDPTALAFLQAE
jgi:hypothetical protein